ncbi:MAG TPA: hypothetical protein VLI54_02180 [Bacillota bacterium]|nr:hypothetical protein [Bacillota bacterium]
MNTPLAEITANRPPDPVETLLSSEFSDEQLWKSDREVFAGVYSGYSGLRHPIDHGYPDTSRYVADETPQAWLAATYGARIVADPEHPDDNGVIVEKADLETMVQIHERLSETVLVGEHAHTSILVDPPEPERATKSTDNNTVWLKTIEGGHWPVMATAETNEQGGKKYFSHDYADYHTANMLLMPRELQDLMSTGAHYEESWRAGFLAEENPRIRGDNGREDPFASGFRGDNGHTDGITKLDNISDSHSYLPLLNYMMRGESGESQLATLNAYMKAEKTGGNRDEKMHQLVVDVARLQGAVGDLLNFNTLHATGRTTTQEAVAEAMQTVLRGTARVADKLQGRPAADVESVAPLSPEPPVSGSAAPTTAEPLPDTDLNLWDEPPRAETAAPAASRRPRFLGSLAARASDLIRRGRQKTL